MALQWITPGLNDRFNCLVFGRPGVGKTSLLRTIPPEEGVCTLSAESGLLAVRDMVDAGRVSGVVINSIEDFEESWRQLATNPAWKAAYRWVFIDSLTEIASRCMAVLETQDYKDARQMWGEYLKTMTRLVKGFRDLESYNVVFTALEKVETDEVKRRFVCPDVGGGKFQERLPAFFDEVFYMTITPDDQGVYRRVLLTNPASGYPAKDRSGRLALVENPNLAEIRAKILGGNSNGVNQSAA